jgi:chromosome segregation ATPase
VQERTSVLTYREQDVLQEIRRVQEEAAAIKRRLQEMDQSGVTDTAERAQWERRLEELRARRNALEKEREEAAQERMRLLGHS